MEKTLAEMRPGERGKILSIDECHGLRRRHGKGRCHGTKRNLQTLGIREGKSVEVHTRQPMGGPIIIKIDNMKLTLGRGMARKIMVEVE